MRPIVHPDLHGRSGDRQTAIFGVGRSPTKRKNVGEDGTNDHPQMRLRQIRKIDPIFLKSVSGGHLFSSGDLLYSNGSELVLLRDVVNDSSAEPVVMRSDAGNILAHPNMCDMCHLEGNWRELLGASQDGSIFSAMIDDDGHISTILHENAVCKESASNELVTSIFHAGDLYVLGTSAEQLYVVSRGGSTASVSKLSRRRGIYEFVKSSASLILGYSDDFKQGNASRKGITNVFSIPSNDRDLLLSIGTEQITLWTDWSQPRNNSVRWERSTRSLLTAGIEMASPDSLPGDYNILSSVLVPMETRQLKNTECALATIAVLSAHKVDDTINDDYTNKSVIGPKMCSLWLHVIRLCSDGTSDGVFHTVLGHLLLEKDLLPDCCGWRCDGDSIEHKLQPALYLTNSRPGRSTDIYVSWECSDGLLSFANCAFSSLGSAAKLQNSALSLQCTCKTMLPASSVVSLNVVNTLLIKDGVSIVMKDGSILHASVCQLPFGSIEATPVDQSKRTVNISNVSTATSMLLDCVRFITVLSSETGDVSGVIEDSAGSQSKFSVMPLSKSCTQCVSSLQILFGNMDEESVLTSVLSASGSICERLPTGHSWGEGESDRGPDLDTRVSSCGQVRMVLREKTIMHSKLIWILLMSSAWSNFPSVRARVMTNHSLLQGALGLCSALIEKQSRKFSAISDSPGASTGNGAVSDISSNIGAHLESAHADMIDVCLEGITKSVSLLSNRDELSAFGLRTIDSFFSAILKLPKGLACIADSLEGKAESSLGNPERALYCAYAVGSVLLSVVQAGQQPVRIPQVVSSNANNLYSGVVDFSTSDVPFGISYVAEIRGALKKVLCVMKQSLSNVVGAHRHDKQKPNAELVLAKLASIGWRREVEGQRIMLLCCTLLKSFEIELNFNSSESSGGIYRDFKRIDETAMFYNECKDVCIAVMLLLHHVTEAFELASNFVHFAGLMASCEIDASLAPLLRDIIVRQAELKNPSDGKTPLGLYALLWLESKGSISKVFDYSKVVPKNLLEAFLKDRPNLRWMHSLSRSGCRSGRDLIAAADASFLHAQSVDTRSTSIALLSVGKLCSIAALSYTQTSFDNSDVSSAAVALYQKTCGSLSIHRITDIAIMEGAVSVADGERFSAESLCDALMKHVESFLLNENKSEGNRRVFDALLALLGEIYDSSKPYARNHLILFWSIVIEFDIAIWKSFLSSSELAETDTTNDLKNTMVYSLCNIASKDAELGKFRPEVLLTHNPELLTESLKLCLETRARNGFDGDDSFTKAAIANVVERTVGLARSWLSSPC